MRESIHQKLQETGEKDRYAWLLRTLCGGDLLRLRPARGRLKEYLRKSLYDCGWHDELKAHCKGACVCGRCGQRCLITVPANHAQRSSKLKAWRRSRWRIWSVRSRRTDVVRVPSVCSLLIGHAGHRLRAACLVAEPWTDVRAPQRRSLTTSRPSCSGKFSSSSPLIRVLPGPERLRPRRACAPRKLCNSC